MAGAVGAVLLAPARRSGRPLGGWQSACWPAPVLGLGGAAALLRAGPFAAGRGAHSQADAGPFCPVCGSRMAGLTRGLGQLLGILHRGLHSLWVFPLGIKEDWRCYLSHTESGQRGAARPVFLQPAPCWLEALPCGASPP